KFYQVDTYQFTGKVNGPRSSVQRRKRSASDRKIGETTEAHTAITRAINAHAHRLEIHEILQCPTLRCLVPAYRGTENQTASRKISIDSQRLFNGADL